MFNKKLFLLGIVFILLSGLALANDFVYSPEIYDSDTGGTAWNGVSPSDTDGINTGGWTVQDGNPGLIYSANASDYDGDGMAFGISDSSSRYTYVNSTSYTVYATAMLYDQADDTSMLMLVAPTTSAVVNYDSFLGVNTGIVSNNYVVDSLDSGVARSTGWHNLTWFYNHSNTTMHSYIDGVQIKAEEYSAENFIWLQGLHIWYNDGGGICEECMFDNFHFWNYTTPPPPPPDSQFLITAIDQYDSTALVNLTAWRDGTAYYTNNGTLYVNLLQNDTNLYDIVITSNDSGGYFNKTYLNVNVSSNLEATLFQAILNLNATEILTNNPITSGLFNLSGQTNDTGLFYVKAGTYNVTFTHDDYYSMTTEFTIGALENLSETISGIYNAIVNVSAKNNYTGTVISSFFASAYGNEYNTTANYLIIPSLIGNVTNISVWGTTYSTESYAHNFSSNYTTLITSLWETGAIKIYFYYEKNGSAITDIDVNILSLNGTTDYDNNTGASEFMYTTISDVGALKITVDKTGFSERVYYETISAGRYLIMNAYFLSDDDSQLTTFQVYNQINQLVPSAQLTFYKLINGVLQRVAMKQTDFSGVATVNLDNTDLYILRVTHNDYLQKEISLVPTATLYRVYLTGTNLDYTNLFDGIEYTLAPEGIRNLNGNTSYTFSLSISAAQNNLEWWGVKISFLNDVGGLETYLNNQTISTGGFANITQIMPINATIINATFFIKVIDENLWQKNIQYYVYSEATGSNRATEIFDEYGDELDDFQKVLLSTFITLGIVGATAGYISTSSLLLGLEILVIFGGFVYVGWIHIWIYLLMAVPTIIIAFLTRGGER